VGSIIPRLLELRLSTKNISVRDAPLTVLGRQQSQGLYKETKDTIQKTAELLVTSPLRRPLSTMVIGYVDLRRKLEAEGKPVVVLPQLQEVSL
jgi:broad specificity phosphatase PhoE